MSPWVQGITQFNILFKSPEEEKRHWIAFLTSALPYASNNFMTRVLEPGFNVMHYPLDQFNNDTEDLSDTPGVYLKTARDANGNNKSFYPGESRSIILRDKDMYPPRMYHDGVKVVNRGIWTLKDCPAPVLKAMESWMSLAPVVQTNVTLTAMGFPALTAQQMGCVNLTYT
jgi:hypothetical protein